MKFSLKRAFAARMQRLFRVGLPVCVSGLVLMIVACNQADKPKSAALPPPPVTVAQAEQRDIPVTLNGM